MSEYTYSRSQLDTDVAGTCLEGKSEKDKQYLTEIISKRLAKAARSHERKLQRQQQESEALQQQIEALERELQALKVKPTAPSSPVAASVTSQAPSPITRREKEHQRQLESDWRKAGY